MVTLFVLSSLEAWPTIMYNMIDGDAIPEFPETEFYEIGPNEGSNIVQASGFCVLFIIVGSFFFMNLFVGVIFDEFEHQKQLENS